MPSIPERVGGFSLGGEGHGENFGERHLAGIAISRDPDGNLTLRNVQPERPVQPIPEREPARPVGVHLFRGDRVMDAVHPRRHDPAAEPSLGLGIESDVRVVENHLEEGRRLAGL